MSNIWDFFIAYIRKQSDIDLMVKYPNCRVEKKIDQTFLKWLKKLSGYWKFSFCNQPWILYIDQRFVLMLKIAQLNIFLTLVRKLCAISSFMMCRQLCLVHQLGVITQSSAEFNNAETLEVTFSKIYMTRSQRWNRNALFTVTKYHICDHNQIVGWNALQSWNGMINSVFL